MEVFVVSASNIFACDGEIIDTGSVIGVYTSIAAAEAAVKVHCTKWRGEGDFEIESFELQK